MSTIVWMEMKFSTHICGTQTTNCSNVGSPMIFQLALAPSSGQDFLKSSPSSSFSKPSACITYSATQPLNDITGGDLSDYMQLSLEPQRGLHHFSTFFYGVVLPKTCQHTFICKTGGVTL